MVIALDPLTSLDYVCIADRDLPEDQQTVWILSPLTARQRAAMDDQYITARATAKEGSDAETSFGLRIHGRNHAALVKGLRGWKNFLDKDGSEVRPTNAPGKNAGLSDQCISRIPDAVRDELAAVILDGFDAGAERD